MRYMVLVAVVVNRLMACNCCTATAEVEGRLAARLVLKRLLSSRLLYRFRSGVCQHGRK